MIAEQDIAAVTALHDAYGLTAREALVLVLLSRGGIVDATRIRDTYSRKPDTPAIEARSAIKRIRQKVGTAVKIRSVYGMGYELELNSRNRVRQVMKKNHFGQNGLFYISIHPDHHINHSEGVSA
jgi:hypothetical protein